jgi:pilus assembly protein CpaD
MTASLNPASRRFALLALALLPTLGACHTKEQITGSIYPADHRDRHPIVIADRPRILDVFVGGPGGLVSRERQDIGAFFREYAEHGSGAMLAQVPRGYGTNPTTRSAIESIRSGAQGRLSISYYAPADPSVASPIRLSFKRLQAKVTGCGLWPDDLGVSDVSRNWRNEQYYNFGCATQSNLASQVADPADLVRPHQESRPDTIRRMWNFEQLRRGRDPSTEWKGTVPNVSVNQGLGQ